ncbi:MAG TPA: putative sugar O-methyltransferase [Stellaceae bacterium]|nr:putative sugar O-methyltransferase [Stellaceae bacterium]
MPQVAIGMPVYNGASTIRAALDSLLAQTFRDFVLIISDNGSSDDTQAICATYVARDRRVRYHRQPTNLGAALNFRFVLMEARTPFFMWAAADDLWAPTFLERQVESLAGRPSYVASQSRVLFTVDGVPSHVSTGTFALEDTPRRNAVLYFTNPADNSRYYGLYRTEILQRVYPTRGMFGLDWGVAGSTLGYGKHAELPNILMIRDASDPTVYATMVTREHRFLLWRVFPLLRMTLHLLRHRDVPLSPRLLLVFANINIYMHFRFGIYRIGMLAERYLECGGLRGALASAVRDATLPGLRQRLRAGAGRCLRAVEQIARRLWRLLPLPVEARFRLKRALFRGSPGLARRLQGFEGWSTPAERTADGAEMRPAPPLPLADWARVPALDVAAVPDFSVVLVASRDLLTTLAAIDSVAREAATHSVELFVVDTGTLDVTAPALDGRADIHYRRHDPGATPLAALQSALLLAAGRNVIVLDQEFTVAPGFLTAAAAGLERYEVIAPQVRSADGAIVSCGGWFLADRGEICRGALASNGDQSRNVAERVDFSPHALVARRAAVEAAGGLDTGCASLFTAFATFGARLAQRGAQCLAVPRAVLFDRTPARAPAQMAELDAEWRKFVSRHPAVVAAAQARHERGSSGRPRLLYVDADTPTPDQNAGSILALNLMRIFDGLGFRVMFVPESNFIHRGRYTDNLLALGVDAVWFPRYATIEDLLRDVGSELGLVVLCRGYIAEKHLATVRRLAPQAKIVFNMVDVHFIRLEREAALTGNEGLRREADRMRQSELASVAGCDATVVVSSFEQELLKKALPDARVHLISLVFEMPAKLDVPGFALRRNIVFVGTYQHPPNVDAVIFFVNEVWPLIRKSLPEARFLIVGSEVTPEVKALAATTGVELLGYVPDLEPLLARCRLSVAPLRFGAGIKGKVGSALQAGLPTVATSLAIEGTPIVPGTHLLVGDSAEAFCEQVVKLYTDEALWQQLSVAGFELVRDDYSFETNIRRIEALLADIGVAPTDAQKTSVFEPSKFWSELQRRNLASLENGGQENFKRTINNNYFQWLPGDVNDPQVRSLMRFWVTHPSHWPIQAVAETVAREKPPLDLRGFAGENPFEAMPDYLGFYAFFVGLSWYHAASHDPRRLHERLAEPEIGNPIRIWLHGKLVSQDLANSLLEWCHIEQLHAPAGEEGPARVLEIGAGYGRLAYVALSASPCRYVIVDIQPALDVAAWYLQQVLPGRRIFGPSSLGDFSGVMDEIAGADIAFLSPQQIHLLPDRFCDVGVSISSLHEMRRDQIAFYLAELDRLVSKAVYFKQWRSWRNPSDGITLDKSTYTLPKGWACVLDREHPVQTEFIELGYRRIAVAAVPPEPERAGVPEPAAASASATAGDKIVAPTD